MALYNIGNFIKQRREELGITQAELAEGLCSLPTLSRLENGSQIPHGNTLRALLQRLGYSDALMFQPAGRKEFEIDRLKNEIRRQYTSQNYQKAKELFAKLDDYKKHFSVMDQQFYNRMYVNLNKNDIPNLEIIETLENTIRLTHNNFSIDNLPMVLTYDEATILNSLAGYLEADGKRNQAIKILYHLKEFYEKGFVDEQEMLKVFPTILYNLSKLLGLSERYDECIEVSLFGIRLMKDNARSRRLAQILYNLSWALVKRGRKSDIEPAKRALKEAYCFALVIDDRPCFIERLKKFSVDNFGEELPLIF